MGVGVRKGFLSIGRLDSLQAYNAELLVVYSYTYLLCTLLYTLMCPQFAFPQLYRI
jgi:hypothetical protein